MGNVEYSNHSIAIPPGLHGILRSFLPQKSVRFGSQSVNWFSPETRKPYYEMQNPLLRLSEGAWEWRDNYQVCIWRLKNPIPIKYFVSVTATLCPSHCKDASCLRQAGVPRHSSTVVTLIQRVIAKAGSVVGWLTVAILKL